MRITITALLLALTFGCSESSSPGTNTDAGDRADIGTSDAGPDVRPSTDTGTPDNEAPSRTIAEILAADPQLSEMYQLSQRVGLDEDFAADAELTVFAPVNAALAPIALADLEDDFRVRDALSTFILEGEVMSDDVPNQLGRYGFADSVHGNTLIFDAGGADLVVNGMTVVQRDIDASNGVVHVVDAVYIRHSALDAFRDLGLTSLIEAAEAAEDLEGGVPVSYVLDAGIPSMSMFAPTNDAFAAAAADLDGASPGRLRDVLLNHFIQQSLVADMTPTMENSLVQPLAIDNASSPPTVEGVDIIAADIKVSGGIIHIIDGVLLP